MLSKCNICGSGDFKEILHVNKVPACANSPLSQKEFFKELIGELDIVMCRSCSHIFNKSADKKIIKKMYNTNYSSGLPNSKEIIERFNYIINNAIQYDNHKYKIILEIGASDFTFSNLLLEKGAEKIIAFEPSNIFVNINPSIIHINKYFSSEELPISFKDKIDLLVMRHVLEHMIDPVKVIEQICKVMSIGSSIYIEVPNIEDILKKKRIYDFFYEHVNYFSPALLSELFSIGGFEIKKFSELNNGQHFGILFIKTKNIISPNFSDLKLAIASREEDISIFRKGFFDLTRELGDIFKNNKKIAIYGAGNHSIAVTVLMNLKEKDVMFLLDINKLKEGFYSPMSHILIKPPSVELVNEIETVVIIASLHESEIYNDLRQKYGFKGKIYGTYPYIRQLD